MLTLCRIINHVIYWLFCVSNVFQVTDILKWLYYVDIKQFSKLAKENSIFIVPENIITV